MQKRTSKQKKVGQTNYDDEHRAINHKFELKKILCARGCSSTATAAAPIVIITLIVYSLRLASDLKSHPISISKNTMLLLILLFWWWSLNCLSSICNKVFVIFRLFGSGEKNTWGLRRLRRHQRRRWHRNANAMRTCLLRANINPAGRRTECYRRLSTVYNSLTI